MPPSAAALKVGIACILLGGGDARESGLSFATAETFAAGGSRGPVLDADDATPGRLIDVIGYANPELAMPPSGQLPRSRPRPWRSSRRLTAPR